LPGASLPRRLSSSDTYPARRPRFFWLTTYSQSMSFLMQSPQRGFLRSHFALRWRQSRHLHRRIQGQRLGIYRDMERDLHCLAQSTTLSLPRWRGLALIMVLFVGSLASTLRSRHCSWCLGHGLDYTGADISSEKEKQQAGP